jgi:hypothetical protein
MLCNEIYKEEAGMRGRGDGIEWTGGKKMY